MNLIERLRAWTTDWDGSQMVDGEPPRDGLHCDILREAADALESQAARIAELEAAICTVNRRKLSAKATPAMRKAGAMAIMDKGIADFDGGRGDCVTMSARLSEDEAAKVHAAMIEAEDDTE